MLSVGDETRPSPRSPLLVLLPLGRCAGTELEQLLGEGEPTRGEPWAEAYSETFVARASDLEDPGVSDDASLRGEPCGCCCWRGSGGGGGGKACELPACRIPSGVYFHSPSLPLQDCPGGGGAGGPLLFVAASSSVCRHRLAMSFFGDCADDTRCCDSVSRCVATAAATSAGLPKVCFLAQR